MTAKPGYALAIKEIHKDEYGNSMMSLAWVKVAEPLDAFEAIFFGKVDLSHIKDFLDKPDPEWWRRRYVEGPIFEAKAGTGTVIRTEGTRDVKIGPTDIPKAAKEWWGKFEPPADPEIRGPG